MGYTYIYNGHEITFWFAGPTNRGNYCTTAVEIFGNNFTHRSTEILTASKDGRSIFDCDLDRLIYDSADLLIGEEAWDGENLKEEVYEGIKAIALKEWEIDRLAE